MFLWIKNMIGIKALAWSWCNRNSFGKADMCSCGTLGLSINRQSVKAHISAPFHRFAPADFREWGKSKNLPHLGCPKMGQKFPEIFE